jgi:hypothetical protein
MATTTPNFDQRRVEIVRRQLKLRGALSNPGGFLKNFLRISKRKIKKKAVKRVNRTKTTLDTVWFGQTATWRKNKQY